MGKIKGTAQFHTKTKQLVQYLEPHQIAVVAHEDIDAAAAESLIAKKVQAVINIKCSMTGSFQNDGVLRLLDKNIKVFDMEDTAGIGSWINYRFIEIVHNKVVLPYGNYRIDIGSLREYDEKIVQTLKNKAVDNNLKNFEQFCENSIDFAKDELSSLLHCWDTWEKGESLAGQDVVIVIRGADYKKDLYYANKFFLRKDMRTIAVDGSADEMIHLGITPDYIIGDMDSVSKDSLKSGSQLIVHQGVKGDAPGMQRIQKYDLAANTLKFLGLSEDAAIAFALKEGAEKIYLIGGHRDMSEYLSKGRKGMGSSLLMKMLAGSKIVDLKGIHSVFERQRRLNRSQWLNKTIHSFRSVFNHHKTPKKVRGVKI
ncbi:putative membrane-anchored protein [Salibacterium salarium]|uniref:putative cytokinetic ring protein SteA n=1 Tax=Salibacterium salarium TaxID=284579 RepID=UPI002786CFAD|nr:putative cytokinetic ring protein SteA [Salibacterium salarium]MDQ0299566.1 putative membrane-anchored protein [Salibacterium salarium]